MKKYTFISTATFLLAMLIAQTGWAAKLYKWVDKDGNISYQDSPPPEGSKLIKEEELNTSTSAATASPQPNIPVIVYSVDNCEPCQLLLLRLQNWGISTQEQSLQNREVQARILELTDSLSAPTLFVGDKLISNLSTQNIIAELQQVGYQIENANNTESSDTGADN